MVPFVIKLFVYPLNRFCYVLALFLLHPFRQLSQIKHLKAWIFLPPTKIVLEQIFSVLFLKHTVYKVATKEHQLCSHLQVMIFYAFVCFIEGMTNNQTILLLVLLKIKGFSYLYLLHFLNFDCWLGILKDMGIPLLTFHQSWNHFFILLFLLVHTV